MAPVLPTQSIDPALAVSKFISSQPRSSQEDPRVLAQMQQPITRTPTPYTIDPQDLLKPVIPVVIQTPKQVMQPMSQEIKEPMPQQVRDNLIAGNVSTQSLKEPTKYLSKADLKKKLIDYGVPQEERGATIDALYNKGYKIEGYDPLAGAFNGQAPVKVAPQITYGENKIKPEPTLLGTIKGFGQDVKESYNKRAADIQEGQVKYSGGGIKDTALDIINSLSQGMGAFQDVVGAGIGRTFEYGFSKLPDDVQRDMKERLEYDLKRPSVQAGLQALNQGMESYDDWKRQNPDTAVVTDFVLNGVQTALDLAGGGVATKGATAGSKAALEAGEQIIKKAPGVAQDIVQGASQIGKKTSDVIGNTGVARTGRNIINKTIERVEGVSKATKDGLKNNPYTQEYIKPALQLIDDGKAPANIDDLRNPHLEAVFDQLDSAYDSFKSVKGEAGEAYNILRSDPTILDVSDVVEQGNQVLKGTDYTLKSFLNRVDKGNLLGTRQILSGKATKAQLHDVRKGIDDLLAKAQANKDSGEFRRLTEFRKIVDNKLKSDPNWAELDSFFQKQVKEMDEAMEGLTYREQRRKGQFRDNVENIIANINNPAKAKMKARLERIMPDLGTRVEAIQAIPSIAKAYQSVPGGGSRIMGAVIGGSAGFASASLPGLIVGTLAGFFGDVGAGIVRTKSIKKAVDQMSDVAKAKLKTITDKIQTNKQLSEIELSELRKNINSIKNTVEGNKAKMITEAELKKILSRKPLPLKSTQAIPVSPQGKVQTTPISPKPTIKPSTIIRESGVAKKPGTTKAQEIVNKLDQQIRAKKEAVNTTTEILNKLKSDPNLEEAHFTDRVKPGYMTEHGKIQSVGYDRGREYYTIGGKDYKASDVTVFKPKEAATPIVKRFTPEQGLKYDSLKKYKEQGQRKRSYLQELMDGKSFENLTPKQVDDFFEMVNKRKRDDVAISKLDVAKQGETLIKTVPKKTDTKIEPKKATVDQELQKVAQKVKEKSLAKKENGSIMDSMKKETLYHVSSTEIKNLSDDKILWTTSDSDYAMKFGKKDSRILYNVEGDLNKLDSYSSEGKKIIESINKSLPKDKQFSTLFNDDGGVSSFFIQDKQVVSKLRGLGYDAVITSESIGGSQRAVGIINPNKVKLSPKSDTPVIPKKK